MSPTLVSLALGLGLVFAGTACTKKKEEATSSTASTDGNAAPAKKVFNIARTSAYKSLDPAGQFDQASSNIIEAVYDRLLTYSYLERPYKLVPMLLTKMPEKKANTESTYVFTLKKGVKFADDEAFADGKGRELTSDDVIYTLKRWADVNVNNKSYVLGRGQVKGMDEFRERSKKAGAKFDRSKENIEGLRKVDDHTFEIEFTKDNPLALFFLATGTTSIVAKEAVEKYGKDFANHPVGTGPFRITTKARRGKMILTKNPDYHMTYPSVGEEGDKAAGLLKDAGKKLPLVDEVVLPLIEEAQPAMLKFQKGELDLIGMDRDNFDKMAYKDTKDNSFHLKDEFKGKYQLYFEPRLAFEYYSFNLKNPVVGMVKDPVQNKKNKALRQAFAYAQNLDEYIKVILNGRAIKLNTVVPLPIAGSERDTGFKYYPHDIEMAKKKLAEAGYPDGKGLPEFTIEFRSTTKAMRQAYEMLRANLAKAGIKVKGNFQTFSSFLTKTESGNFQIANSGWMADYPDAENFFQLLYGPNTSPGPNESTFNNARYNELFLKSKFMKNGPERNKIFKEMSQIIKDEVPVLVRFNGIALGLHQNNIKNFKRNMMIDQPWMYLSKD